MKINIKKSIVQKKLEYNKSFLDSISDILPTISLSIIALFLLMQLILNIGEGGRTIGIITVFLILVIMLTISTIKEYVRLYQLQEIRTRRNKGENKKLALAVADKLNWKLLDEKTDYITVRNPSRFFKGGENITLIFGDNLIFFNSSSYPINDVTRTTLTFGINGRNLAKFKKQLKELEEEQ
jgi:hypothetical protein